MPLCAPGHADARHDIFGEHFPPARREISAVLAADVAGYTALMEADQDDTHGRLMLLRSSLLDPGVANYGGRIVKYTGDGFLAAFGDPLNALRCAVLLQSQLVEITARFPPEHRILFRMGLNFCENIIEATDIYGEGVNVAARLMAYAEPGDVALGEAIAVMVPDELRRLPCFDMGHLYLKNIKRPVRTMGVRVGSVLGIRSAVVGKQPDGRPSIAVLPFRTHSDDPSGRLCAEGIVDEITHALASVSDLFVVARGSTVAFSAEHLDMPSIGRQLGVRYLLHGSVQCGREQVRVFTQLSDAETGRIVTSNRYDAGPGDLFEVQSQIAAAATTIIAPNIKTWDLRRAMRKHPENLTAYDLLLQARLELYKLDYESHSRARGLLQRAIALEPDYAATYSHVAYWYIFRIGEGWSVDLEVDTVEAGRAARAAIERDEEDALALSIYGHVQSFLFRDFQCAMAFFDRAIRAGPNCPEAWSMSSLTLGYLGDGEAAVERAAHGLRLSPLDAHIFYKESTLAQAHYVAGHHDAAVAWARRAQAHNSSAMFNDRLLAASLATLGRFTEARDVADGILRRKPAFRLGIYRRQCPFRGAALETWIQRLRQAGLPE